MHKIIRFYALTMEAARQRAATDGTLVSCVEVGPLYSDVRDGRLHFLYEAVVYCIEDEPVRQGLR
jgi:hypothetical protein